MDKSETMPTILQERLADKIIENLHITPPKTKQEMAVEVGYSLNTADDKVPANSAGVIEALRARGFDPDNGKRVVAEIVNNADEKSENRLRGVDMIFKVHGTYAPEKSVHLVAQSNINKLDDGALEALLDVSSETETPNQD